MGTMSPEYHREWRAAHMDSVRAASRRYREKNAGAVSLASNHGMSIPEARAVIASRPDACEICSRRTKLMYDHDHSTGTHRGWLCNRCNHGLHMLDNPELLVASIAYLGACRAAV